MLTIRQYEDTRYHRQYRRIRNIKLSCDLLRSGGSDRGGNRGNKSESGDDRCRSPFISIRPAALTTRVFQFEERDARKGLSGSRNALFGVLGVIWTFPVNDQYIFCTFRISLGADFAQVQVRVDVA